MVLEKKRFFIYFFCGSPEPKAPGEPKEWQPRCPLLSDIVAFVVVYTFKHKYLLNQIDNLNKASQAIQSPRTVPFFLLVSLLDGYPFPNVLVKGIVAFKH